MYYPTYMTTLLGTVFLLSLFLRQAQRATTQTTRLSNRPNEVVHVNLLAKQNCERHHTNKYDLNGRALVLRRGEPLQVILHLSQAFNTSQDKLRLELALGNQPQLADKTLVYMPLVADIHQATWNNNNINNSYEWDASLLATSRDDRQLSVRINLPPVMAVGVWRLRISTKLTSPTAGMANILTFAVPQPLYVIFNPWAPLDDVYMAHEDARQEYVLNEVGKIYVGTATSPVGRQWTYGQFEPSVLPAVMFMLDRLGLSAADRTEAVAVGRAVSAMVNSNDDGGFVEGKWEGAYGDGLAPWTWTSSAPIFRQYVQSGYRPVKYGQCWVFGGMTTTTLRSLGIPARTISNFVSAHDTDASLTVDKFLDRRGELRGVNRDSTWNFHVWSDAWMARNDLPPGYGGWQAIDATPQESSMGKYQMGPASLEAIKQGKVGFAYDVGFVFSEINAHLVHWHVDSRNRFQWRRTQDQDGHHGRKILTKRIGVFDYRSSGALDAEDIVSQYKYREATPEALQAHAQATEAAGLTTLFSNTRR